MAVFVIGLAGALSWAAQNAGSPAPPQAPSSMHTVTVTFTYDFSKTPACSATVTKACIQQFNVYDITAGLPARTLLFFFTAPPGETKLKKGITGKSQLISLKSGNLQIAVTAQTAEGKESATGASTTSVEVVAPASKPATAPK